MYESLRGDVSGQAPDPQAHLALASRHAARARKVQEIVKESGLKTAKDHFEAAVILVETSDPASLLLAQELALKAAEMGQSLGFRVAAEAIDKQLVVRGQPQRYGTQYEWVAVLQAWRLYPVESGTSDAERKAMGVPPLVELYAAEDRLNPTSKPR